MSGLAGDVSWREDDSKTPFIYSSATGFKVMCRVCGRTGWGELDPERRKAYPWQRPCLDGHPYACACGERYPTGQGIGQHLRRNPTHTRSDT